MCKNNIKLAETVVKSINKRFAEFSREYPELNFLLIDNENNVITELSVDGALIEFKMLANDGSEYLKLRSPNDISVKIKAIDRSSSF